MVSMPSRSSKIRCALIFLLFVCQLASAQERHTRHFEVRATKYLLGTKIDFVAMHPDVTACKAAFFHAYQEIERIERVLSCHQPESEISRINGIAGEQPLKVSWETFSIIERAVGYSERFGGAFDISIGPLTEAWGFNEQIERGLPDRETIGRLLTLVSYREIVLSRADTTVFLKRRGMKLDLGGIGKGYAIDQAAAMLRAKGVNRFLINAGGDIFAGGAKYGSRRWTVGLQHPRDASALLATFEISDMAVATSGDYERYKFVEGRRYHHIIDPKTGFPAREHQSTTVFAPSAELADVWATYLFISNHGGAEAPSPRQQDIPAILVKDTGEILLDPSVRDKFGVTILN